MDGCFHGDKLRKNRRMSYIVTETAVTIYIGHVPVD